MRSHGTFLCSLFGCTNRFYKGCPLKFHSFPFNGPELLKKWIIAVKRDGFKPTKYTKLCSEHFVESDYHPFSRELRKDSVPSIFKFPEHLVKVVKERAPVKRVALLLNNEENTQAPKYKKSKTSPTKEELKQQLEKQKQKIKTLNQKIRRKDKKVETLTDVVKELREKQFLSDDSSKNLELYFSGLSADIIKNHYNNQNRIAVGRRHSDEVKRFAMTLHFYSPRAYEHVRSVFMLPHAKSIANWTSSVDCEAGFFIDVFRELKQKVISKSIKPECALFCDGMKIRSSVIYNKNTGSFEGFVNFGKDIVISEDDVIATEALVFMLVGLRGSWKYPIGYVLIASIDANNLHCLLSRALELSAQHNLSVHSITLDGPSYNLAAMRLFGCNLGNESSSINGKFKISEYQHDLYFFPDPCHMVKLARNALADLGIIAHRGIFIEWKYFVKLNEIQLDEGFKFANRLSNRHIQYQRHKMNVSVAAQTLSSSVADAIEFLMESGHPFFTNASATIRFIRMIDELFDLLNSKNLYGRGFKKPLDIQNKEIWLRKIKAGIEYLSDLQDINGVSLLKHRRKTFVLGFITSLKSIQDLALYLLTKPVDPFNFPLVYKLSQDHVELLFSCIKREKMGSITTQMYDN